MSSDSQQKPDGSWEPATPIPVQGLMARIEFWLRKHQRFSRVSEVLAWFDERGLG